MIKNYFIIAWRNLWKNKTFSVINIFGLSIGLACCIVMFLFTQHELSFYKFNVNAPHIYRVTSETESTSGKTSLAVTPAPCAPLMKKDFPAINNYFTILTAAQRMMAQPGQQ